MSDGWCYLIHYFLQRYNNQDRMRLAEKYTHKSIDQNSESNI